MESLWPRQSPAGAANSLHQTLFYLRRDIDPWFNEAHSVHYLVVEPDLVFFDRDLVQVDSSSFLRQAAAALMSDQNPSGGPATAQGLHRHICARVRVRRLVDGVAGPCSRDLPSIGAEDERGPPLERRSCSRGSMSLAAPSLSTQRLSTSKPAWWWRSWTQERLLRRRISTHTSREPARTNSGITAPSLADLQARRPDAWPSLRSHSVSKP